jgi:hypothetical protein
VKKKNDAVADPKTTKIEETVKQSATNEEKISEPKPADDSIGEDI